MAPQLPEYIATCYRFFATSSVEEGLDFGCSLLSDADRMVGEAHPEKASQLLNQLTSYIQFRYVGEPLLALECLAWLGRQCEQSSFRSKPFWAQLKWVAGRMNLKGEEMERFELPNL